MIFKSENRWTNKLFELKFFGTLKIAWEYSDAMKIILQECWIFGEFSSEIGSHKQGWYTAGEFGFDKR